MLAITLEPFGARSRDQFLDLLGGGGRAAGQLADFLGDDGKASGELLEPGA